MKIHLRKDFPLICIIIVLSPTATALLIDNHARQENDRIKKWEVALKKEPLPKNAIELKLEYSFPNDEQVKNDIYIASGRDICIDREDHIYVSDWKAAKILEFDFKGNFLKAFGRKGQGPGEYTSPGHLFCDPKNNLLIDGQNHQILTFDPNGKFVKSLKTTKSHTGYAIDADGRIYASCQNRKYEEEDLIEVIDQDGASQRSFGKRILFKNITMGHNDVFLDISRDQFLYVVWRTFNVFRKYSLDGELLIEGKIKYQSLDDISNLNLDSKMVDHSIKFRSLFDGMCEDSGKIYLLKYYPRIEIFECNESGEVERVYWSKGSYDYIGREIIIVNKNDKKYFITMQVYPEEKIEVYSVGDKETY